MIDLRSDTAARASPEMLAAMAGAETGRYLPEEDAETAALEAEAALRLGHEAALFMPTATMANLAALLVHTRPGDTVVVPRDAHVLVAEAGGLTAIAGVLPLVSEAGDAGSVLSLFEHLASRPGQEPALAWLENTHTRSGGSVSDATQVAACVAAAHAAGARVHVDGARLPNAAAALGIEWRDLAAPADSVTVSLNKGLGAPVGAVLAGSSSFVREAAVQRERLGGAWRKPGHLAAAGRVALRTAAASFERRLREPRPLPRRLERRRILANARRPVTVRLVTHSALGESELARVVAAIRDSAGELAGGAAPSNALPAGAR